MARPIPVVPPVMKTRFPFRVGIFVWMLLLLVLVSILADVSLSVTVLSSLAFREPDGHEVFAFEMCAGLLVSGAFPWLGDSLAPSEF
jgi:hypothetical protein